MTIQTRFDFIIVDCTEQQSSYHLIDNDDDGIFELNWNGNSAENDSSAGSYSDDDSSIASFGSEMGKRTSGASTERESWPNPQQRLEDLLELFETEVLSSSLSTRHPSLAWSGSSCEDDNDSVNLARNRGVRRLRDAYDTPLLEDSLRLTRSRFPSCSLEQDTESETADDDDESECSTIEIEGPICVPLVPLSTLFSPANTRKSLKPNQSHE